MFGHFSALCMKGLTNQLKPFRNLLNASISILSTLHEECPYLEFPGPHFSALRLNTKIYSVCKSSYSVQMRENNDQKDSEYGHFLRSTNIF